MKEIVKVEYVEKTVTKYVASDGEEFYDSRLCQAYESSLAAKELDKSGIEICKEAEGFPNFDGGENYESHFYRWYRPQNSQQIELLRKAYNADKISEEHIGHWICIELDCGDDFVWLTSLDDSIEYARQLLEKLGYEMTITKKVE